MDDEQQPRPRPARSLPSGYPPPVILRMATTNFLPLASVAKRSAGQWTPQAPCCWSASPTGAGTLRGLVLPSLPWCVAAAGWAGVTVSFSGACVPAAGTEPYRNGRTAAETGKACVQESGKGKMLVEP
jgi:hypothetical protein